MNVPTPEEARLMTEQAILLSGYSADPAWIAEARRVVLQVAGDGSKFCANDVWKAGLTVPANRRALGYVMRLLQTDGLIRQAGRDTSRFGHGQSISIWELATPVQRAS